MLNRWKTLTMAAVLPKTCEIATRPPRGERVDERSGPGRTGTVCELVQPEHEVGKPADGERKDQAHLRQTGDSLRAGAGQPAGQRGQEERVRAPQREAQPL